MNTIIHTETIIIEFDKWFEEYDKNNVLEEEWPKAIAEAGFVAGVKRAAQLLHGADNDTQQPEDECKYCKSPTDQEHKSDCPVTAVS